MYLPMISVGRLPTLYTNSSFHTLFVTFCNKNEDWLISSLSYPSSRLQVGNGTHCSTVSDQNPPLWVENGDQCPLLWWSELTGNENRFGVEPTKLRLGSLSFVSLVLRSTSWAQPGAQANESPRLWFLMVPDTRLAAIRRGSESMEALLATSGSVPHESPWIDFQDLIHLSITVISSFFSQ